MGVAISKTPKPSGMEDSAWLDKRSSRARTEMRSHLSGRRCRLLSLSYHRSRMRPALSLAPGSSQKAANGDGAYGSGGDDAADEDDDAVQALH
mmetsp:Transcript_30926/g.66531  ORF Transcript_30926/g.66531 Transcript_30926/m.66531 type:complete len:93 (-) Transcript_30926:34-312(-)